MFLCLLAGAPPLVWPSGPNLRGWLLHEQGPHGELAAGAPAVLGVLFLPVHLALQGAGAPAARSLIGALALCIYIYQTSY